MRLVSTFSAVHLAEDPSVSLDGDLYFNSASGVFRYYLSGSWVSISNSINTVYNVGHNIHYFLGEGEETQIDLQENYSNSILYFEGEGAAIVNIPSEDRIQIKGGSIFKIVKAGSIDVDVSFDEGVQLNLPSSIYLKAMWDTIELVKTKENNWIISGEFRDLY